MPRIHRFLAIAGGGDRALISLSRAENIGFAGAHNFYMPNIEVYDAFS